MYLYKGRQDVPTLNIPRVCDLTCQRMVILQLIILYHIYSYHLRKDFVRPITTPPNTMRVVGLASEVFICLILIHTSGM
jgi:hypothetical protein